MLPLPHGLSYNEVVDILRAHFRTRIPEDAEFEFSESPFSRNLVEIVEASPIIPKMQWGALLSFFCRQPHLYLVARLMRRAEKINCDFDFTELADFAPHDIFIPEQKVTSHDSVETGKKYCNLRTGEISQSFPGKCVGTIISHGAMGAFFSRTEDINDISEGNGIHVCVGKIREDVAMYPTSLYDVVASRIQNGIRVHLPAKKLVDIEARPSLGNNWFAVEASQMILEK